MSGDIIDMAAWTARRGHAAARDSYAGPAKVRCESVNEVLGFASPSGTIHVGGDRVNGFTVSHESSSGNSWGEVHGPYPSAEEAIRKAVELNRYYGGDCKLNVSDAAAIDACPGVGLPSVPGDF